MKVHPITKKRSIDLRYNVVSCLSESNGLASRQKKLRRLPHVFARVLEIPFTSDADVSVRETSDSFRFVVATATYTITDTTTDTDTDTASDSDVRATTLVIYPGITKVVIGGSNLLDLSSTLDDLELDAWRFRLPASTMPELATEMYGNDGELVVIVPKAVISNDFGEDWEGGA